MTLRNLGRMVQHIREGRQKSNRVSVGQYKIHCTAPHGAESPLVLESKEPLTVDLQHLSHANSTYIIEGEFVERKEISVLDKHSRD